MSPVYFAVQNPISTSPPYRRGVGGEVSPTVPPYPCYFAGEVAARYGEIGEVAHSAPLIPSRLSLNDPLAGARAAPAKPLQPPAIAYRRGSALGGTGAARKRPLLTLNGPIGANRMGAQTPPKYRVLTTLEARF